MSKLTQILILSTLLLQLLPAIGYAQTCHNNIPASTPNSRFTPNYANATVVDSQTGLMWKMCSEGQTLISGIVSYTCTGTIANYTWQAALQQAETVNTTGGGAGYTDWRVPNVNELDSLVEQQCFNPAINLSVFPDTPADVYWTSSPRTVSYNNFGNYAWFVDFVRGDHNATSYRSGSTPWNGIVVVPGTGGGSPNNKNGIGMVRLVRDPNAVVAPTPCVWTGPANLSPC